MGKSGSGPRACNVFVAALVVLVLCLQNTLKSEEVITKSFLQEKARGSFLPNLSSNIMYSLTFDCCVIIVKLVLHLCSPTCYPVQSIEFSLCLLTKVVAWHADASAINEQKNTQQEYKDSFRSSNFKSHIANKYLADAYLLQNQK